MGKDAVIIEKNVDEKLAIEGGNPVRTQAMPLEFPGVPYFNELELEYINRVVKARNPFRFY